MTIVRLMYVAAFAAASCGLSGCAGKQLSFGKVFAKNDSGETVSTQPAPRVDDAGLAKKTTARKSAFLDPPGAASEQSLGPGNPVADSSNNIELAGYEQQLKDRLDPPTFDAVMAEFRDVSPEHRADWLNMLATIEPKLVPQMLVAHRAWVSGPPPTDAAARTSPGGTSPENFVTYPPERPAGPPVIQPASDSNYVAQQPASPTGRPVIAPGLPIERPMPQTTPPVTHQQQSGETAAAARAVVHASNEAPSPASLWPPNDMPAQPIRQTGFVEMPAAVAPAVGRDAASPEAADTEGRYALANDWDTRLHRLIDAIEQELAATDASESAESIAELQVYLRMLYLMDGQQTRALQAIPGLEPSHQEFWTQMFWGLTNYFDKEGIPDPGHRATETITQMRSAIERLKPESRLQLRNATFSHKINSFGDYEQFARDEFDAGQPVLVYVEVQNFSSQMGGDSRYKTRLRSTIEIHKAGRGPDSGLVHTQEFPATEDTCRNLRQDYFHSYRLDLPADLSPGPHVVKLMVEDEISQRIATTSLSFVVK